MGPQPAMGTKILVIMTKTRTTTERRHSKIDQVFKVSPTLKPKYSLMSQKPASLRWERNMDPAPMAITSNVVAIGLACIIDMALLRIPAVVRIETVAEPVAIRTNAAIIQPSRKMDMLECSTKVPMILLIPVETSTPLKPPPAPTIRRIPATAGREAPNESLTVFHEIPEATLRTSMDTIRDIANAITGLPMKLIVCAKLSVRFLNPGFTISKTDVRSMSIAGRRMHDTESEKEGSLDSSLLASSLLARKSVGASIGTHREAIFENSGPTSMRVMSAKGIPTIMVSPTLPVSLN